MPLLALARTAFQRVDLKRIAEVFWKEHGL